MKKSLKFIPIVGLLTIGLIACSKNTNTKEEYKNNFVGSPRPSLTQSQIIDEESEKYIGKTIYIENDDIKKTKSFDTFNSSNDTKSYDISNVLEKNNLVKIEINVDEGSYNIPSVILIGGSPIIFINENENGIELNKGDKIILSIEKHPSEIIENQSLAIGLIKNGKVINSKILDELEGQYEYQIVEDGEYFLYLESFSSDYLSIEGTSMRVEKQP